MTADQYPSESWIHVYTDGSATDAVPNGGSGVYAVFPDGHTITVNTPTGKHCSNYSAEVQALMQAASTIQNSTSDCLRVVFLTDALTVLEAVAGGKLPHLIEKLQNVERQRRVLGVVLQWLPAHCGVPGNEKADKLPKLGAQEDQADNPVSFTDKKTLKAAFRPRLANCSPPPLPAVRRKGGPGEDSTICLAVWSISINV
ncbi:ribonuclease H1-like [Littorina saxatilis]|uniref:RNase H type-1 domain-containing protein n=1 Tax=Littorina saxatilis TaxID=31220 RepID=A0AAN9B4E2_9CAEN